MDLGYADATFDENADNVGIALHAGAQRANLMPVTPRARPENLNSWEVHFAYQGFECLNCDDLHGVGSQAQTRYMKEVKNIWRTRSAITEAQKVAPCLALLPRFRALVLAGEIA